jgi:hypothetical protein
MSKNILEFPQSTDTFMSLLMKEILKVELKQERPI